MPENCKQILNNFGSKTFNIICQNIRSVGANFDSFQTLIARTDLGFDIIILAECWLQYNPHIPPIQGFKHITSSHPYNQNDGVVVYTRNNLLGVTVEEPQLSDASSIMIKIGSDTVILAIYRPDALRKQTASFFPSLDTLLRGLGSFQNVILMGDINIDITPASIDTNRTEYLNLCAQHGLLPSHTIPTHYLTCLDHVMLKTTLPAFTIVVEASITDHFAVVFSLSKKPKHTIPRTLTRIDDEKLEQSLLCVDFGLIYELTDPDMAVDYFVRTIRDSISSAAVRFAPTRRHALIKPWMTPGLLKCLRNRDNLYKKLKRCPKNEITKITYRRYRNFCSCLLKKAKRDYEIRKFADAGKDPRLIWKAIRDTTNISAKSEPTHDLLHTCPSQLQSANDVNSFFINAGRLLAEECAKRIAVSADVSIMTPPPAMTAGSFALLDADGSEIERIIVSLKSDKSAGWDGIPSSLLKKYKSILVPPLTFIINMCLSTGVFPGALKKAVVHPIHKSGDRSLPNNYRPISVLPSISKVLEKAVNSITSCLVLSLGFGQKNLRQMPCMW
jgi:hypothetical protein